MAAARGKGRTGNPPGGRTNFFLTGGQAWIAVIQQAK
jgi:hypothetical protein